MENNEIMVNEEVIEVAEEFIPDAPGKGLMRLGVGVAIVVAGYALVKKVIIPSYQKHKAKKERQAEIIEYADIAEETDEE